MISIVKHDNAYVLKEDDRDILVLSAADLSQLRDAVLAAHGHESHTSYRQRVMAGITYTRPA